MRIDTGWILPGYRHLRDVLAPLGDELSRCFWVVDIQPSPFDTLWVFDSPENEALLERRHWGIPAFAHSSPVGLRPGSLPELADVMRQDEFSHYLSIDAPEEQALRRATALKGHIGDFSDHFLREHLATIADLFICHADGWWEFYCPRAEWAARFRDAWPEIRRRPLARAGKAPTLQELA